MHILLCYYVYSLIIMQEKFKNAIKTNSKFDSIRRNSNIDYDSYLIFNAFAFPLNLTSTQKSPLQNSHRSMGIHHSPYTHSMPISMGIPMGISVPTAALLIR